MNTNCLFLAIRFPDAPAEFFSALSEKDVTLDSVVIANHSVLANDWQDSYLQAVKNLKPGLTETTSAMTTLNCKQ